MGEWEGRRGAMGQQSGGQNSGSRGKGKGEREGKGGDARQAWAGSCTQGGRARARARRELGNQNKTTKQLWIKQSINHVPTIGRYGWVEVEDASIPFFT